jgi:hypothetical protein
MTSCSRSASSSAAERARVVRTIVPSLRESISSVIDEETEALRAFGVEDLDRAGAVEGYLDLLRRGRSDGHRQKQQRTGKLPTEAA